MISADLSYVLLVYARLLDSLSKAWGCDIRIIKMGIAFIIILLLVFAICLIYDACTLNKKMEQSIANNSNHQDDLISQDLAAAKLNAANNADQLSLNQNNIALTEAYLEMLELNKAQQCLAQLDLATLTDAEIQKSQELKQCLDSLISKN